MRIGISTRLFLAVLATAGLAVAGVIAATRWNFERGFLGYINGLGSERMAYIQPRLEAAYAEHGNWYFMADEPRRWFELLRPSRDEADEHDPGHRHRPPPGPPPASELTGAMLRMGLVDAQSQWIAGYREITPAMQKLALRHDGRVVGWLVMAPFESVTDGGDQRFQQGQARAAIPIAVLAIALAAAIAWWIAHRLLAPVRRIAEATHRLAAGDHAVRVAVSGQDEVGRLGRDFNHLALTLERNAALRRDFVADISHELRTPLAVLGGELEALEDGIRPLVPAAVTSLQGEVRRLAQLVSDLDQLALSDAGALSYRMAPVDLGALLARVAESQRPRVEAAGLALELRLPDGLALVSGDAGRLQQLFDNLIENSRRYTDAPGRVRIGCRADEGHWVVDVDDSAPGLAPGEHERLFERFYRVESSRSRASGGAGLGLAICRNIALAHGGTIAAQDCELGGVRIELRLPRAGAGA